MGRVTLARAWNPDGSRYAPGDDVEVDDATEAWLRRTGAVAGRNTGAHRRDKKSPSQKKAAEPTAEDTPVSDAVVSTADKDRPARSASLDTWREYAEKQGVNTKGLSKQDLIAATK